MKTFCGNKLSFKAVIRACGQAAVWQQSLQMLFELTTSNLEATF